MPVRVDRTNEINHALSNVYLTLFKDIKKDSSYPDNIPRIRADYQRKVYDASRKAITQVFSEGHEYVSTQLRVETYQSDSDTALIKQETDKAVGLFWTRIEADARREREIVTQKRQQQAVVLAKEEEPLEDYDTGFYMQNAALIATTGALAISTLSKTNQIVADPELDTKKPKIRWVAQQDEKTCTRLPSGGQGCAFLDGQEWDYDDVDIPVPGRLGPNGTHPNCRCYLDLTL
jgi:Phage Mu protein F like protein.